MMTGNSGAASAPYDLTIFSSHNQYQTNQQRTELGFLLALWQQSYKEALGIHQVRM